VLYLFPLYFRINVVHYGTMGVHTVETQSTPPSSGWHHEKKNLPLFQGPGQAAREKSKYAVSTRFSQRGTTGYQQC
jgi:hypothetical protein